MDALRLPTFCIPDLEPKRLTGAALERWRIENLRRLHASGLLTRIRERPSRRPVGARFVLK